MKIFIINKTKEFGFICVSVIYLVKRYQDSFVSNIHIHRDVWETCILLEFELIDSQLNNQVGRLIMV